MHGIHLVTVGEYFLVGHVIAREEWEGWWQWLYHRWDDILHSIFHHADNYRVTYIDCLLLVGLLQSSILLDVIATSLMPIKSPFDCVGELWLMLREVGKESTVRAVYKIKTMHSNHEQVQRCYSRFNFCIEVRFLLIETSFSNNGGFMIRKHYFRTVLYHQYLQEDYGRQWSRS